MTASQKKFGNRIATDEKQSGRSSERPEENIRWMLMRALGRLLPLRPQGRLGTGDPTTSAERDDRCHGVPKDTDDPAPVKNELTQG